PAQTGVILTHGNHADSLQVGLRSGRPWLAIGGAHVEDDHEITAGELRLSVVVGDRSASLCVDGTEVSRTTEWWRSGRWRGAGGGGGVVTGDRGGPPPAGDAGG